MEDRYEVFTKCDFRPYNTLKPKWEIWVSNIETLEDAHKAILEAKVYYKEHLLKIRIIKVSFVLLYEEVL